jgi:hypothetical protein
MEEAFAPIEAAYREQVRAATWGHLAPKKNLTYNGRIVFAFGVYESGELNPVVIASDFDHDLDGGPWFYEAVHAFLDDFTPGEPGRVYEWRGTFRNYKFKGRKPRLLLDVALAEVRA